MRKNPLLGFVLTLLVGGAVFYGFNTVLGAGGSNNVHISSSDGQVTWRVKDPKSYSFSIPDSQSDYALVPGNYLLDLSNFGGGTPHVSVGGNEVSLDTNNIMVGSGYPFTAPSSGSVNISISVTPPPPIINGTSKVLPSSATVSVGSQISLRSYLYSDGAQTEEVTSKNPENWVYDPYYLAMVSPGVFEGLNPGVSKVYYDQIGVGIQGQFAAGASEITVIGAAVSRSGSVSITKSNNYYEQLFPSPGCGIAGKDCKHGGVWFLKNDNMNDNIMIGDEFTMDNPAPAKGNHVGMGVFDISDPENPKSIAPQNTLNTDEHAAGDFGAYLRLESGVVSKDLSREIYNLPSSGVFGSKDGGAAVRLRASGEIYGMIEDQSDNKILATGNGLINVTDWKRGTNGQNYPLNLPSGYPASLGGQKLILSNGYYLNIDSRPGITTATMKIFKAKKSSPVATVDVSNIHVQRGGVQDPTLFYVPRADGDYIVILKGASTMTYGHWADFYQANKAYIFKFDGTKLTKVVDGLTLDEGRPTASAGVKVGGKEGFIVSLSRYTGLSGEGYLQLDTRPRVYLLDDLLAGITKNVLSFSPSINANHMTSYVSGNATYIYVVTNQNGGSSPIYLWKLESISGGTSGGGGGGGGTTGGGYTLPSTSCDFTLTPSPTNASARQGAFYAIYTLKAPLNSNPLCAISVTLPTIRDASGSRVIYPDDAAPLIITPGSQGLAFFNIQNADPGIYTINLKASARGVSAKTIPISLTVNR